jgi:hypothetical protein
VADELGCDVDPDPARDELLDAVAERLLDRASLPSIDDPEAFEGALVGPR